MIILFNLIDGIIVELSLKYPDIYYQEERKFSHHHNAMAKASRVRGASVEGRVSGGYLRREHCTPCKRP